MSIAPDDAALRSTPLAGTFGHCSDHAPHGGVASRRMRTLSEVLLRPVQRADQAQAQLFDNILQVEIAELEAIVQSAEARWTFRQERGIGDRRPPDALVQLRARVAEARRLLDALRYRFPSD